MTTEKPKTHVNAQGVFLALVLLFPTCGVSLFFMPALSRTTWRAKVAH